MAATFTFSKAERLCSRKLTDELFSAQGSRSMTCFPVRAVFRRMGDASAEQGIKVLFSVPKRHLRHAVDRNRTKRQLREAYRLNKHLLDTAETPDDNGLLLIAFIWLSPQVRASATVSKAMTTLLARIAEKL